VPYLESIQLGLEGVQIDKNFDLAVPSMVLDEKKIKQVFINLFMNARHAIGNTGTIKVESIYDFAANQVLINVADTGHGIENENLSRIFDPFFTTKPTGEGTGLGLSVSYGIVKNHGGDISVKSRPGQGSRGAARAGVNPARRLRHRCGRSRSP